MRTHHISAEFIVSIHVISIVQRLVFFKEIISIVLRSHFRDTLCQNIFEGSKILSSLIKFSKRKRLRLMIPRIR